MDSKKTTKLLVLTHTVDATSIYSSQCHWQQPRQDSAAVAIVVKAGNLKITYSKTVLQMPPILCMGWKSYRGKAQKRKYLAVEMANKGKKLLAWLGESSIRNPGFAIGGERRGQKWNMIG